MSNGRFRSRLSGISPELLEKVAAGSEEHVQQLFTTLDPQDCTIDVVKAVLKHLQLDLVPDVGGGEHDELPYPQNGRRALFSISILNHVFEACRRDWSLNEGVVELLMDWDCVEGLCLWANLLVHFGLSIPMGGTPSGDFQKAHFHHAKFFSDLLDVDPRVRSAFLTSPTFSKLLIRFWMATGKRKECFIDLDEAQGCPIVHLLLKLVSDDDGRQVLFDQIMNRPRQFAYEFAKTTVERFQRCASPRVRPTRAIAAVDGLIASTSLLVSDNTIKRRFIAAGYLGAIASSLYSIYQNIVDQEQYPTDLSMVLMIIRPFSKLFALASEGDYRIIGNWEELVKNNFMTLLVQVMLAIQPNDRASANVCIPILRHLSWQTVYPQILFTIISALAGGDSGSLLDHPLIRECWGPVSIILADRVRLFLAMPMDMGAGTLCDNPMCDFTCRLRTNTKPKKCSRCSCVVYCSSTCQKIDWDERHQVECRSAVAQRTSCRARNSWYSHTSTRPFHMALLASHYSKYYNRILDIYTASFPPETPDSFISNTAAVERRLHTHTIPVLNFASSIAPNGQVQLTLEGIHYLLSGERDRAMGLDFERYSGYLGRRYHEMLFAQRVLEVTVPTDSEEPLRTALIEGMFPQGDDTVITLTVKLEKRHVEGGEPIWEGVYSTVRFGCV
ncbi:hypothetical protein MD484_g7492, partial [Candolleomyces efflorescens]